MTLEVVTIRHGTLVIERRRTPVLDLDKKPAYKNIKEKRLPKGVDLGVFVSLATDAFPELGLSGKDFSEDLNAGREKRVQECQKLARAGYSAIEVSGIILQWNPQLRAAFHLGDLGNENLEDARDRLGREIAKYYPGKRK